MNFSSMEKTREDPANIPENSKFYVYQEKLRSFPKLSKAFLLLCANFADLCTHNFIVTYWNFKLKINFHQKKFRSWLRQSKQFPIS